MKPGPTRSASVHVTGCTASSLRALAAFLRFSAGLLRRPCRRACESGVTCFAGGAPVLGDLRLRDGLPLPLAAGLLRGPWSSIPCPSPHPCRPARRAGPWRVGPRGATADTLAAHARPPRPPPTGDARWRVTASDLGDLYAFPRRPRWLRSNFVVDPRRLRRRRRRPQRQHQHPGRQPGLRPAARPVRRGARRGGHGARGGVRADHADRRRRADPPTLVVVSGSGRVPEGLRTPTRGAAPGCS